MNTPYSKDEGWTRQKVNRFVRDCSKVAGRHIARPITDHEVGRVGLYPYSVTVHLEGYLQARNEVPDIPNSVDEILATETANAMFEFGKNFAGTEYFNFVYDQREPYRGHIVDRQRNSRAVKEWPMMQQIVSITDSNMRIMLPLQLADLWAWCVAHKRDGDIWEWQRKMLNHPSDEAYGNYENLSRPKMDVIERARKCKFPKRKSTQ
jgi:hypothetical protein